MVLWVLLHPLAGERFERRQNRIGLLLLPGVAKETPDFLSAWIKQRHEFALSPFFVGSRTVARQCIGHIRVIVPYRHSVHAK